MDKIREPAVAGYFYPDSKIQLLAALKKYVPGEKKKKKAVAVICPHAGYIYSGRVAGLTYAETVIPETVIILGPNHNGYGEPYAVAGHDAWRTPLGDAPVDTGLAEKLVKKSGYIEKDSIAHRQEHSIEVQVPFLQYLNPDVKIVPVCLNGYLADPAWEEIGRAIAETVKDSGKNVLIVASTDLTHYEDRETAEEKDRSVLDAVNSLDEKGLAERILEQDISMCGFAPVITALVAAKRIGAMEASVVKYATSGDFSGDYDSVVGYAGVIIT